MSELSDSIHALLETCINGGATQQRFFLGIGEESGEVIGAFNKFNSGREDKPRTPNDVRDEAAQLIACTLMATASLDIDPESVMQSAISWARWKIDKIS